MWKTELEGRLSFREAVMKVLAHGKTPSKFVREVGEKDSYTGEEIHEWLETAV